MRVLQPLMPSAAPALRSLTPWPPLHFVERGNVCERLCRISARSPPSGPPSPLAERGPGGEASEGRISRRARENVQAWACRHGFNLLSSSLPMTISRTTQSQLSKGDFDSIEGDWLARIEKDPADLDYYVGVARALIGT